MIRTVRARTVRFGSPHWTHLELLRHKSHCPRIEEKHFIQRTCSWVRRNHPGWVPSPEASRQPGGAVARPKALRHRNRFGYPIARGVTSSPAERKRNLDLLHLLYWTGWFVSDRLDDVNSNWRRPAWEIERRRLRIWSQPASLKTVYLD